MRIIMKALTTTCFVIMIAASIFAVGGGMPDFMLDLKWHASLLIGSVVCAVIIVVSIIRRNEEWDINIWESFTNSAMIVCTGQAFFYILQLRGAVEPYGRFTAASFDNVAGLASCLSFSIPLGISRLPSMGRWQFALVIVAKIICVMAIIMSGSRTGLLCTVALVLMFINRSRPCWLRLRQIAMGCVVVALVLALSAKTDSSRGRWFILCRSAELVSERPFFGHGIGGFAAHYMDTQAKYFALHPDDTRATLAGNIRHPLCEYMLVAVNFGLVGVVLLLLAITLIVVYYKKHFQSGKCNSVTWEYSEAMAALACIGVFAMFSYPLSYPFTWIVLAVCIPTIFSGSLSRYQKYFQFTSLLLCIIIFFVSCRNAKLAKEWGSVQEKALLGLAERMMPCYEKLYPKLMGNRRFLYNYAAMQYDVGRYTQALRTAIKCRELMADYELCLLEGDIHRALCDFNQAIACYQHAHHMCPSRFTPLYEQYRVLKSIGDSAAAEQMANTILAKPIKVNSISTQRILDDVRRHKYKID